MGILVLAVCLILLTPMLNASIRDILPLFGGRPKPVPAGNQKPHKGSAATAANRVQYYGKAPYSTAGRLYFRGDDRDRKRFARR